MLAVLMEGSDGLDQEIEFSLNEDVIIQRVLCSAVVPAALAARNMLLLQSENGTGDAIEGKPTFLCPRWGEPQQQQHSTASLTARPHRKPPSGTGQRPSHQDNAGTLRGQQDPLLKGSPLVYQRVPPASGRRAAPSLSWEFGERHTALRRSLDLCHLEVAPGSLRSGRGVAVSGGTTSEGDQGPLEFWERHLTSPALQPGRPCQEGVGEACGPRSPAFSRE
ncbi:uncharacterized protein LOC110484500 [Lonchura striata]